MELSQEQLEELVEGKPAKPRAVFYEEAVINQQKSKEAGRRIYDKALFVRESHAGVRDSIAHRANEEDIRTYPDEYRYFMSTRQGTKQVGIEVIPNLDVAHLQELRDYGLLTIPKLAEAESVPLHLEYARQAAVVFNKALQETNHAHEEESKRESPRQAEDVSQIRGREHGDHVGQPETPRGNGSRDHREVAGGNGQGRRAQRSEGVNWANVRIA
jgi:hypothetical protein